MESNPIHQNRKEDEKAYEFDNEISRAKTSEPPKLSPILSATMEYASRGWPVLPLFEPVGKYCSCSEGKECNSPGKHPRIKGGYKSATTEMDQIIEWWTHWPNANIGIKNRNSIN